MKYDKDQRLEIGRKIYCGEITKYEAAEMYGLSPATAREYMRLYRDVNGLPSKRGSSKDSCAEFVRVTPEVDGIEKYESMTKEELIQQLVMARINEARLKKGYEVKGDGTVILYDKENTR